MVGEHLTILIAEDDPDYRDLYGIWLAGHEVRTRANGDAALAALDDDVDLVFLDRDMPGRSGTEVAAEIEAGPRDPYVVMVSSREPKFDIANAPIDGYVRKPAQESDVLAVVDQCRTQEQYKQTLDEYFSLTAKLAALEVETDPETLADDERYQRLQERVAAKRAEVDEALGPGQTDWQLAFKTCPNTRGEQAQNPNA